VDAAVGQLWNGMETSMWSWLWGSGACYISTATTRRAGQMSRLLCFGCDGVHGSGNETAERGVIVRCGVVV
jgi:hypothetical protein